MHAPKSKHLSAKYCLNFCFILIYFQQAYFKCAYDCFDRRRTQEAINNCVENCGMPVLAVNNVFESEMAKFQVLLTSNFLHYKYHFFPIERSIRLFFVRFFSNLIPLWLCACVEIMIDYLLMQ